MRQFRFLLVAAGLLAAVVSLSACSVGMALSGEENPDLAVCRVGAEKSDVESQRLSEKFVSDFIWLRVA